MERKIYEAAVEGNVTSLHNLLQEDTLALDRCMVGCYTETPLHIASILGHAEFVQEILTQKPELAGELDSRKSSPLHLAAAKGFLDIVERLVSVNPEMCFVCDQDGRNPLHIASIKGKVNVLRELVQARPHAARSLMARGETILHLCVRYKQLEALKFLLEAIDDHEFVNTKDDDDGNNILHLATVDKQVETVKLLCSSGLIEVNALNARGMTAMDILKQSIRNVKDWEIGETLRQAGTISARDMHLPTHDHLGTAKTARSKILKSHESKQITFSLRKRKRSKRDGEWFEKKRNALMVVASLIATMAFQAGLSPPGGLWQDTSHGNSTTIDSVPHDAGFPILADYDPYLYRLFMVSNTTGYVASLSIIPLLISGLPFCRRWYFMGILTVIMWIAIIAMGLAYLIAIAALSYSEPQHSADGILQSTVWLSMIGILLLGHTVRLILRLIKVLIRRRRTNSSTDGHAPQNSV